MALFFKFKFLIFLSYGLILLANCAKIEPCGGQTRTEVEFAPTILSLVSDSAVIMFPVKLLINPSGLISIKDCCIFIY